MYWTDIGVDRIVPDACIRTGWAEVFGLQVDALAVTGDLGKENPWDDPRVCITVVRYADKPGEFPLMMSMIVRGDDLEGVVNSDDETIAAIQRFCVTVGCRAITATEADGVSGWTLVTPSELWHIEDYDPDEPNNRLADAIFEPMKTAVA